MATLAVNFTDLGAGTALAVKYGDSLTWSVGGTFDATVVLERSRENGLSWATVATATGSASGTVINEHPFRNPESYRFRCSVFDSGTVETSIADAAQVLQTVENSEGADVFQITETGIRTQVLTVDGASTLTGAIAATGALTAGSTLTVNDGSLTITNTAAPTKILKFSGASITAGQTRTVTVPDASTTMVGTDTTQTLTAKTLTSPTLTSPAITAAATDAAVGTVATPVSGTTAVTIERIGKFFVLNFTLTAAQIPVTDGAGAGSHGALKIFDFIEGGVSFLGCRQDYTAFAEGAALTGGAGDAVFEIGVGTTAISAAADGILGANEDNVGGDVNITLVAGTGAGTEFTGSSLVSDGTATAVDLNLNWSGTAATIDANSTIDVTGTITVVGVFLGDD